jgi:hypothetical protein
MVIRLCASRDRAHIHGQMRPLAAKRPCLVCGSEFRPVRSDARCCTSTCRQRLHRGQRLAYLQDCPPAQQLARQTLHQAIEDTIAIEKVVRAARRERRMLARRMVRKLAPLTRGPSRSGGII